MTSKSSKDKTLTGSPRLIPRPTAASAARAARNASNRNITVMPTQRSSPVRTSAPSSPAASKFKSQLPRRSESKSEFKIHQSDIEMLNANDNENLQCDLMVFEDNAVIGAEEMSDQKMEEGRLEEINENLVFEIENQSQLMQLQEDQERPMQKESARSRPHTPAKSSRPHTPRSYPSSRPTTPAPATPRLSRPTTPAHPGTRHLAPAGRPNTPRANSRPITPVTSANNPPPPVLNQKEEDVKSAYAQKEQEFQSLKKELDLKQQAVLEVFDAMVSLRERMTREGVSACGEGNVEELVVFNVADWTAQEVRQLCQDAAASSVNSGAADLINAPVVIDEQALADLDANVLSIPRRFADLCLQAYTTRQELIDWIKGLIEHNLIKDENGDGGCLERISHYNAQGFEWCESLRQIKNHADDAIDTVSQLSRRACRERNALLSVGESLVREIARLRQDIEAKTSLVTEMRSAESEIESTKPVEESREHQEKITRSNNKEKLATTESQLRQARTRITKMDRQLREAEATIASLTTNVKSLEDQSRQREVQLEARARKLKESLKTGEVASGHLVQQRDALQAQINDLKNQIEHAAVQHKAALQDMAHQKKEIMIVLEEQRRLTESEKESKEAFQSALGDCQNMNEDLKKKVQELEISKPNPDLPTKREMDLWAELEAVKETLHSTEDEVMVAKREKIRFLESFTKITETDNKVGLQQRLAAELLSKEEIMAKMQSQIRDLMKNIKLSEQKVIQYEQYVRDLQSHYHAVANCQESPNGISYQDLQREIMNLKMSLLEAGHQNEELTERLAQKEQQIEQQDKTSRAQARVIKVREELINMLKNKETEQSRELIALQQDLEHRMKIVDEVNKQIAAKADEIHELFSTLENKQQQIHRLEKIVLALEEQQRRAQAQRTRHEEKIATLEHELAANVNRRERKFLFF